MKIAIAVVCGIPMLIVLGFVHWLWMDMAVDHIDKYYGLPVVLLLIDVILAVVGLVVFDELPK